MGMTSKGRKPNEWAAKINHTHIINDPFIKQYLNKCSFPKATSDKENLDSLVYTLDEDIDNPIQHILSVDGGYTTVEINKNFPSSEIAFFQFGALLFETKDLLGLSEKHFIFPEDIQKLQKLNRFKLALPIKNTNYENESSLTHAFRKSLYEFFLESENVCLLETLSWLIFEKYKTTHLNSYTLGSNPYKKNETQKINLNFHEMSKDFTFEHEDGVLYLTDVFRLHEAIDDDIGASGVLGYVTRLVEQIILIHFVREIRKVKKELLNRFLFITDGPLSFSGQTANMHKAVRNLCNFLLENENLYLVGLEKSGAFVDHAHRIKRLSENDEKGEIDNKGRFLAQGQYLILDNQYIYRHITIGDHERMQYGSTSYYGCKVIYHSRSGQAVVLSLPTRHPDIILKPQLTDYKNIDVILKNISLLKCDMYDDSIVPIALANKLVSLANHPSQVLLDKFASQSVNYK